MDNIGKKMAETWTKLNPKQQRNAAIAGLVKSADDQNYERDFWGGSYNVSAGHLMPTFPLFVPFELIPFFMHRTGDMSISSVWTSANSGTGTALTLQDANGGRGKFVNGAGDNNYYYYFSNGEVVKLTATTQIYIIIHCLKIKDVDQADWFIGLCKKLASGNLFDNRVDAIGFYGTDGSAVINAETTKNGTASQVTTGQSLTDETEMFLMIHIDGTSAAYFFTHNSAGYRCIRTASLPDDEELAVAFGCRNGQAAANEMTLGQIMIVKGV